jgi:hypothetical protein
MTGIDGEEASSEICMSSGSGRKKYSAAVLKKSVMAENPRVGTWTLSRLRDKQIAREERSHGKDAIVLIYWLMHFTIHLKVEPPGSGSAARRFPRGPRKPTHTSMALCLFDFPGA